MALTTINSAGVKDDSIVNADIKSDAAIAVSKLADFTANDANNRILTATGTKNSFNGEANLTYDGTTLVVTGDGQFTNDVLISDHIKHHGDTDTALRFPAADTFTVETGGSERVRVKSTGVDLGGTTNSSNGIGVLRTKHHTTSNDPVNMIGCASGSGYNNVQIGGNDTSFTGTASTAVRFYTAANATTANGTYRGQWDGSGNLSIDNGDLVVASGHGISFAATADGTGIDNELLDDYEEGITTATCDNSVTLHSNSNALSYTKIGRLVTVIGQLRVNSDNSNAAFIVNNLPFTAANPDDSSAHATGAVRLYSWDIGVTSQFQAICWVSDNSANIQFAVARDGQAEVALPASAGSYVAFTLTYIAA
jgi:hypothetical protein